MSIRLSSVDQSKFEQEFTIDEANEIADGNLLDPFRLISPHVRTTVGRAGAVPICFEADGSAVVAPNPE